MNGGVSVAVGRRMVLTCAHVTSPRGLRREIESLARLRSDLAHENAHLQLEVLHGVNSTGLTGILEALKLLSGVAWLDERPQVPSSDADPVGALFEQRQDVGRQVPPPAREAALPRDGRAALLHLLDGTIATLGLALVCVLAGLSHRPDALMFVLIMLAVCRRYGRREEPANHAFLPTRRFQTSLGSRPQK
jgi:hypothetical protein